MKLLVKHFMPICQIEVSVSCHLDLKYSVKILLKDDKRQSYMKLILKQFERFRQN